MERIVSALISFDQAGQDIVREAKEWQMAELGRIEEYKQQMYQKYRARLEHDLERFEHEATAEQEERLADLQSEHMEKMEVLRRMYRENNERWVAEMTTRCTEL